jgi:hypothetical protein
VVPGKPSCKDSCLTCGENGLFCAIPAPVLKDLDRIRHALFYRAASALFMEGEPSSGLRDPPAGKPRMGPFECLGPDIVEDIRRIKSHDGPDLILSGSSTLTSTLLAYRLADEVLLLVYPVLLGKGKRLFAEGTPPCAFELASTKALSSGTVINTYKAAGPLKNLPF